MKHTKIKIGSEASQEALQATITEQATLVSLEVANALETPTEPANAIDMQHLLNRHLNEADKAIVAQAVLAYPDKAVKIVAYANQFSGSDLVNCLNHSAF
jgi:ribosomal protein L18E